MPSTKLKTKTIRKVLILGSGGLRIGQAGEFDYSGSQAIKALKEEDIFTILINPNIATIQTDDIMADKVYLQPLNLQTVSKIIEKEKPDSLLLGFGGQTALNLGIKLDKAGVLKKHKVKILGTQVQALNKTEDRDLFKKILKEINVKTAKSFAVNTVGDALKAAKKIKYPIMMRVGFALGGLGSGVVKNDVDLKIKAKEALHGAPQILIEEYLGGWKEVEYEIVRDSADNTITVCNMENFDPMGIHTGESIVVAPSQTLNNFEYHMLREVAIKTARHIGIIGECNIQYALNPKNSDYRVIEINARLSRSSALASKATGYPLAFVAAKLALGKRLDELKNSVTKKTSAFFEPALDYLVVKIPRWDINKLKTADRHIGSEMKSVGEVMAIGRSFPEALQKAVRMLNIGYYGLAPKKQESKYPQDIQFRGKTRKQLSDGIAHTTDERLFDIYNFFRIGGSINEAHELSKIDKWFLSHVEAMAKLEKKIKKDDLVPEILLEAKKMGFGDKYIADIRGERQSDIRRQRIKNKIKPVVKQIDTLAGEFPSETNYLYMTYHGTVSDIPKSKKKPIIVFGSGPYCIGSSVEFDWCAVNTARTLRKNKEQTIIINSNPETVSTDYDESDRLYFEELTLERIQDIADFEKSKGIIVSVGGQIANNLATLLDKKGYKLLGTKAEDIDNAENRQKFSTLLNKIKVDQPTWSEVSTIDNAKNFAKRIGYPILVRPSYVLSGAAMNVVHNNEEMETYLGEATVVSPDHPVVMSQFIDHAKELEVDGVADAGKIQIYAITEHIENAGVHSGDATIVLPPQRLYLETIRRAKRLSKKIVKALNITGPFNIQFLAKENWLKVIECNLRASRSFPFVSKVTGYNFIEIATNILLGKHRPTEYNTLDLDYVGVKTPQFSYNRLKGADPVAHVEMASTGEVATIGSDYLEAFFTSWLATEQQIQGKRLLLSIGGDRKVKLKDEIIKLDNAKWNIFATNNTHKYLAEHGVASTYVYKASEEDKGRSVLDLIENKEIDLIINIPRHHNGNSQITDGYKIRRLATDHHIPLITNLQLAELFLRGLTELNLAKLDPKSWQDFVKS
jgi:carbamoyl-phosphate synthase large subunit